MSEIISNTPQSAIATANNPVENEEHATTHDTDDDAATTPSRWSVRLRAWCWCCRNCTGVFLVLGIVNAITLFALNFLMEAIEFGSETHCEQVWDGDNQPTWHCSGGSPVVMEGFAALAAQLVATALNLGTVYCLCRRYNSGGRDFKAMRHVFGCCRRTRHQETIRPVREVVAELCRNCRAGWSGPWVLAAMVGTCVLGFAGVGSAMAFPSVGALGACLGGVSVVLWIGTWRWVLHGGIPIDDEAVVASTGGPGIEIV